MAKTSQVVRAQKPHRYAVRHRNRCRLCGRPRAYLRYFDLCRICFRGLANEGHLPGVRKSSW